MRSLSKYLFATLVISYMLTVVGMPVYLHYCGGQVEEISYLIETNGCCEDEEPADGCCRNEGVVLQNAVDFTLKTFDAQLFQPEREICYLSKTMAVVPSNYSARTFISGIPIPWQHALLAEITVLRI